MCGIIGLVSKELSNADLVSFVSKGLDIIRYRGKDSEGIEYFEQKDLKICIGHLLHSIVGRVGQPLISEGKIFAANCEIYNWKELCKKYDVEAKNDAELIFKLIELKGIENLNSLLEELDGVFAFVYFDGINIYLARDILGLKPIWYTHAGGFGFCSEKKTLEQLAYVDINELNPRKILKYNLDNDRIEFIEREFFKIEPEHTDSIELVKKKVEELLTFAVKKRIPQRKFALLFSGGIDSTIIALVLKKLGCDFECYTCVFDDPDLKAPEDLGYAKRIAADLGLKLNIIQVGLIDAEKYLKIIVPLIEDSNVVKSGVALTFYAACEQAKKDGCKVIFSGLGSEEIFAGYLRHKESYNVNNECVSGLLKMYERDLYRDDVITMYNSLELRVPFLDHELVEYSLKIPEKYKLFEGQEKYVLRLVGQEMGLKEEWFSRRKKAAQYGSNFHKAITKLTKKAGFSLRSEYLRTFYSGHNVCLGALVSSGKDGVYAMDVMARQNYKIGCMITMKSKNPDSFMFHVPAVDLVRLQAESVGVPLIEQETLGEKETELKDLKAALVRAKEEFKIEGVVSGALFSNYQRKRIEAVCDELGLKIFSPLWHVNQETEMREIINQGFKFIFTRVAAECLGEDWLGREITLSDVDKLAALDRKFGFNVAGEGGEFESLMIDGPNFSKRIEIIDSKIEMQSEIRGDFIIEESKLVEK
ncbi:diphthine--ammonia ligase [Candidatus Woesearchaeota archaeon]|jgi:diphthine-ammonia ligase|nr:diphthine--ammonia ligase [Candidatus Woesearchaeota archaeon]MBT6518343.1 diphthine--ammonia ligase [Candidatus Woesearchaeota archaeon]MBT7366640.1 diphthine--ammonia ligase [Candidatus Woesearchaeota archaeon]